ncbi:MAG: Crp/Fnr family transcriptional regulator [Spirochaetaceae bacterium]|nr:MAG: Crp/Fnr family transcriptional regulator [Spirochaetaceae bacterium]
MNSGAFERFAVTFDKGEIIFCEYEPGDSFYLIQSGRVQISKIMGGLEKTVDILHPGEIFGEMAILEEAPRSANAIAIDDVKALEFNRANFEILMRGNPQIALKLLKLFTKRVYDQRRRFMILTLDDVSAKVADVFLMLNEMKPPDNLESDERVFHTTAEDIAHWAGISPEKARDVIQHFASQRRLELMTDRIIVKNINEFVRFVNSRRRQV